MKWWGWLLIAVVIWLAAMTAVYGQNAICSPTKQAEKTLSGKHGENRIASGRFASAPFAFSLWVNLRTGSWTLLRDDTGGRSCVIGLGIGFKAHLVPMDEGDPA